MMFKIYYWVKKQIKKTHGGYNRTFQKYENISAQKQWENIFLKDNIYNNISNTSI